MSLPTRTFLATSMLGLVSVVFVLGYVVGSMVQSSDMLHQWQSTIAQKYDQNSIRHEADIRLLASKIAHLDTQILRLEVLGEYFANYHNIDVEEIDFLQTPGFGGADDSGTDDSGAALTAGEVDKTLQQFGGRFDKVKLKIAILTDLIGRQSWQKEMLPEGWPVEKGWISSNYGSRISPFTGRYEFHSGIDIAGHRGVRIYAVASGIVKRSRYYKDYGKLIEIEHTHGYTTRYAHNDVNLVYPGDAVKQGDVIALMGSTGRSTGPHLHFEVLKRGHKINPREYLGR